MRRTLPLLLLLAGCAGSSGVLAPADKLPGGLPALTPSASATVEAGLSIERWWLLFEDTELNHRIDQALADNTDLAIAAARLREARARLTEVHAARLPSVTLQGQNARSRSAALPPGADRLASSIGAADPAPRRAAG